jgi:S-adenosylmethionine:tRNA ribosyltransferase-isomerase
MATVNLSVGAGTFQPVKVDNIEDHDIHSEYLEVSDDVVALVKATKKAGKKVFAVGTTATRALETAFIEIMIEVIAVIPSSLFIQGIPSKQ